MTTEARLAAVLQLQLVRLLVWSTPFLFALWMRAEIHAARSDDYFWQTINILDEALSRRTQ